MCKRVVDEVAKRLLEPAGIGDQLGLVSGETTSVAPSESARAVEAAPDPLERLVRVDSFWPDRQPALVSPRDQEQILGEACEPRRSPRLRSERVLELLTRPWPA